MRVEITLNYREQCLARRSVATISSLDQNALGIPLPQNVKGLKILDICSGVSSTVSELRENGAMAYGIDFRYADLKQLEKTCSATYGLQHKLFWYLRNPFRIGGLLYEAAETLLVKAQRDAFFRELASIPEKPYAAGMAGGLPFQDKTFDICYSKLGLSTVLINDFRVLIQTVQEGIRVLKPGGQFFIYPWFTKQNVYWDFKKQVNSFQLLDYLHRNQYHYQICENEVLPQNKTLVISK